MSPTTTPGTVFSTPSDREVAWTRCFAAPRERVFRALTEPEHVQRWMLGPDGWTMPICEMDLRVGGGWRCVWRARPTRPIRAAGHIWKGSSR